jgi:hypothetical protein
MNGAVSALRLFFTTTCSPPEMARHLRIEKQPQKLPVVLTLEEPALHGNCHASLVRRLERQ